MDLGLQGKVIVVTGGASGIGAAITRLCLTEGAQVAILSRSSPGVPEFLDQLNREQLPFQFYEFELEDPNASSQAVEQIRQRYGHIDGVVNNAGVNDGAGLQLANPETFLQSLQRNLVPAYALTHYALPLLKASRGAIVNIASKVALTGQGNTSGYAAAKGALLALTREWAVDLLPFGIRVNCVIPAEVMTPAYTTWLSTLEEPEATLRRITTQIPLAQRMTTPAEIASAVVFLLSPTQSGHTTGQQVVVDGGYVHLDRLVTAMRAPHD